jgi:hypothetical protein
VVRSTRRGIGIVALLATTGVPAMAAAQPDLGHKLPGAVGLDAATQPEPGLYAAYRFGYWDAISARDRSGAKIPVAGFDIDAFAHVIGVGGTLRLDPGVYLGTTLAVPVARISASVDDGRDEIDRFGLGDVYFEPLQIGGRWPWLDVIGSYAFYAPTRQLGREGLGAPQWAHQLSLGATLWFAAEDRFRICALVSYDLHQRKQNVDVTRGDIVQIQGGIGGKLFDVVELGVAGFALWQVTDDRGSELPTALRGRRDRVYGLGPELNLLLPRLGAKIGVRYVRDIGAQGRPEGQLVVAGLSVRFASRRLEKVGARPTSVPAARRDRPGRARPAGSRS